MHPATKHILQFFKLDLPQGPLPVDEAAISVRRQFVINPLDEAAVIIAGQIPDGPEKTVGLRKLLEARDCFLRAVLSGDD